MSMQQIIYLAIIFLVVSGVVLVIFFQLSQSEMRGRLQQLGQDVVQPTTAVTNGEPVWVHRMAIWASPLARLSLPEEGWENSQLRIRFMNAGYRGAHAPILFFALKTLLTFVVPLIFFAATLLLDLHLRPEVFRLLFVLSAALGYFLPNLVLWRQTVRRKREIFEHFPDAIDLMTVCVEAGLGLDAALARVGEEMSLSSQVMGEEMHLVNLELRAGSTRERALRNLALRTGVEEVDMLVAMLVQSDRFGTSVADALRVHSDSLRTKRRLRAEEAAAKIPLKLLFPLIFCVFPSMLLVLLGPAFISIYRILLPTFAGQQ
ncbi:MAG: type II secretion system F family protein [Betaproteobacteria bacterium]|nr:type II secretion system F family protein [Betaproteobacteria bacterium]